MKKASYIGLIGAILWLSADVLGIIVGASKAISEGLFKYVIDSYVFSGLECLSVIALIYFIYTLKKRMN